MTEQEAIYCMKAGSERYSHVCEECSLYGETGCDHCYDDANDVAIKALEKQIPKKPIVTGEFCSYKIYCCPCCREELYEDTEWGNMEFAYCTDCGQKLDWRELPQPPKGE